MSSIGARVYAPADLMERSVDEQDEITAKRDAAARARRLLFGVFDEVTGQRMLAFAVALEAEADTLEQSIQTPPEPLV